MGPKLTHAEGFNPGDGIPVFGRQKSRSGGQTGTGLFCEDLPEKSGAFIVASSGLRQGDVHMENVADGLVLLGAVAFPGGFHALGLQKLVHGLGMLPEEIMAGGGDEGRGIFGGDGFQHPEPGIVPGKLPAQIVQMDAAAAFGCPGGHVIHTAVQPQTPDGDFGNVHMEGVRVFRICDDGGVLAGQLSAGGVAHQDDPAGVQMIAGCIFADPLHDRIGVPQGCGEFPPGGQAVIEIHKGKAPGSQVHTVAAIDFLGSVDIAAAVNADDGGQGSGGVVGVIYVQKAPFAVTAVGNVAAFGNAGGQGNGGIPFPVGSGGT